MNQSWQGMGFAGVLSVLLAQLAAAQVLVTTYIGGEVKRYNEASGAAGTNLTSSISGPSGLTRGPDGFIYATSQSFTGGSDLVVRINPTTGVSTTFTDLGVGYGPASLRFHPSNGDLYVSKYGSQTAPVGSGRVDRFNGTTGVLIGAAVSNLTQPTGLTFNGNNLYISNQGEGNVKLFNGTTTSTLVAQGSGGLAGPAGLGFGPGGNLYVVDLFGSEVKRYTAAGVPVGTGTFAAGASLNGNFPSDLLFDTNGKLWVANLGASFASPTGSLVRFDATTGVFFDTVAMNLPGASQLTLIPVPEPAALVSVGGLLAAWWTRRRLSRPSPAHGAAVSPTS
jgi:DNA-binding beta-propeller fold protein YncE